MTLDVPAPDAGSYQVRCTVPGHDQLGMTGTLVVVAGSGDAAAGQADTMDHMQHANMTAEEMATAHEGRRRVPRGRSDEEAGQQPLEPRIEDGVRIFDLDITNAFWGVSKGVVKKALAYNGQE